MARILGIDPGTRVTGFGAVDVDESTGGLSLCRMGVLKAPSRKTLAHRLYTMSRLLDEVFDDIDPAEVAIEQPFVARNVRAAFAIGEARGISLIAAAARDLPVHEYPPASVRETVAGHGGAAKSDVASMVRAHLGLGPGGPEEELDATDAVAVALCHAFRQRGSTIFPALGS